MTLTVGELIKELKEYPPDWEIMISVRGEETFAQNVDMETGGVSTWLIIDDFKEKPSTST